MDVAEWECQRRRILPSENGVMLGCPGAAGKNAGIVGSLESGQIGGGRRELVSWPSVMAVLGLRACLMQRDGLACTFVS